MQRSNTTAGTFRKERITDKTIKQKNNIKSLSNSNSNINNDKLVKELSLDDIDTIRNTLVELGISPYVYKGNNKHNQLYPTPLSKYMENSVENGWVSPIDTNDETNQKFNLSNLSNNNNNNNNNQENTPNNSKTTFNVDSSLFTPAQITYQSNSNNTNNQLNENTLPLTPTQSNYDPSLFIPSPKTSINYHKIMHYKTVFNSVNDSKEKINSYNYNNTILTNENIDNISNFNINEDAGKFKKELINMRKIEYDNNVVEEEVCKEYEEDVGYNKHFDTTSNSNIIYPNDEFITSYCYYYDNNDNLKIFPTEIIQKMYLSHLEYENKLKLEREETIKSFQISLTNKINTEIEEFENKLMKNKFMNINKNSKSYKYIEKINEQHAEAVAYGIIYEAIALFAHPSSSSSSSSSKSLFNKKINHKPSSLKSSNNILDNDMKKVYKTHLNDAAKTRISNKIIKYKSYVLNSLEENLMYIASNRLAIVMKDINLKQEICVKQLQNDINLMNSTKLADYLRDLNINRFTKIKQDLELYNDIDFNNFINDDVSINNLVTDLVKNSQGIESDVGDSNNSQEIFEFASRR
jgi:hypothetical protein